MKHVYNGPNENLNNFSNLSANQKYDFTNNLIRSIPHSDVTTTPRAIQLKNRSAIRGGLERQDNHNKDVDVVQLKEAMNRIR